MPPATRVFFRDPAGALYLTEDRVLRLIRAAGLADFEAIERSRFAPQAQLESRLIAHRGITEQALPPEFPRGLGTWIEHPRISFPSFPEEWCWGMLDDAAQLTLELALEAEKDGLELKDASPRNIMFIHTKPCFIDLLSFRRPLPGVPGWLPLTAFLRGFLFPLALSSRYGLGLGRFFLADREGISHEETERLVGFWGSFRAPFWRWLRLPRLLDPLARHLQPEPGQALQQPPGFLRTLLTTLRNEVTELHPPPIPSEWLNYEGDRNYSEQGLELKTTIVRDAIERTPTHGEVLDMGANAGEYSLLSARHGRSTLALDRDMACIQRLYERAQKEALPILPLVMDLSRPTPAGGWAGLEQPSFLERAEGRFDLVLALALVHHLRFPAGIPLHLQMEQIARFTKQWALVEWIPETDIQVVSFIERYHYLPADYHLEGFEAALAPHFQIEACTSLSPEGRTLYLLEKRA